ncbi:MAG: transketolase [Acholeplasmataceae bacterium]|nr:transketolase [Acholeplasmataceae bacterium]
MNQSIQAIRFLGADMIDKASSGHPGIVLGAAPVVYHLFTEHLKATSTHPKWFNRDRFVLSAGHGSALLYATLHCAGYKIGIEDLKQFRQLGSITPGHPEYGHTDGVEATTGPLGQGISMAVGMAIAESHLRAVFNREGFPLIDHDTFVLVGDGDLQEGVTMEAMSLAGHLQLDRLIVFFDSNDIQLDGPTENANSDNWALKAKSMNWHYEHVADANDLSALNQAILNAKKAGKPTLIEIKSIIGEGALKQGTSQVHGAPLGAQETERIKQALNYPLAPFSVDKAVYDDFQKHFVNRGETAYQAWELLWKDYQKAYPEAAKHLHDIMSGQITVDLSASLRILPLGTKEATRNSIGKQLDRFSELLPALMGGSADLVSSTKVHGLDGNYTKDHREGRNLNFGVREHAMGAIANGLTLHGLRGFTGGFFVFSDYLKPAIRLAALMKVPTLFLFTHDSVAVGEDGPTHQPIEQLSMFRLMPNLTCFRPADANETAYALHYGLKETDQPTLIALTRQNITVQHESSLEQVAKGGYVAIDKADYQGILIASGSEVELAIQAQEVLEKEHHIPVRVVSMPSLELFLSQPESYQESVLPKHCQARLAMEMGASGLWYQVAGKVMGIDTYGMSGPLEDVKQYFGFTSEKVVEKVQNLLKKA